MRHIGITATRRGLAPEQKRVFAMLFDEKVERHGAITVHHGCCVGGDAEIHRWLRRRWPDVRTIGNQFLGMSPIVIIGHPCHLLDQQDAGVLEDCNELRESMPPLTRNHHIVDEGRDMLYGFPGEATEQLRSGTWATIRYARKVGRANTVILPDGSQEVR